MAILIGEKGLMFGRINLPPDELAPMTLESPTDSAEIVAMGFPDKDTIRRLCAASECKTLSWGDHEAIRDAAESLELRANLDYEHCWLTQHQRARLMLLARELLNETLEFSK